MKQSWNKSFLRKLLARRFESVNNRDQMRRVGILKSFVSAALAKVLQVGVVYATVPLTISYLGPERYGLWMTITSLIAVLTFADLGVGNGIVSRLAAAHGRDDETAVREIISSGLIVLLIISAVLTVCFTIAWALVPWAKVFNVSSDAAISEAGPAMAVFLLLFAMSLPVSLVSRVQIALQQGYIANAWQCIASLLSLLGVLLAIRIHAGLPLLVLAIMGGPIVVGILNYSYYFHSQRPEFLPRIAFATKTTAKELFSTGGLFFVLQIVAALTYASDNLIIAQILGATYVAEYSVVEKIFGIIPLVLSLLLAPLWPVYGEAIARGDYLWAKRALIASTLSVIAVALILSTTIYMLASTIVQMWVGDVIEPGKMLLASLGVWKVVEAAGMSAAAFLNGMHVVKPQILMAVATAICAIILKFTLIPVIGTSGAVASTTLSYLLLTGVPLAILLPRLVKHLKAPARENNSTAL